MMTLCCRLAPLTQILVDGRAICFYEGNIDTPILKENPISAGQNESIFFYSSTSVSPKIPPFSEVSSNPLQSNVDIPFEPV